VPVRTTLTIDEDVAAKLAAEARRSGRPFRAVVNEALRSGLELAAPRGLAPFTVEATDLGVRPGIDLDDIWGLIERVEGPRFK
jgi:hypothetical protein